MRFQNFRVTEKLPGVCRTVKFRICGTVALVIDKLNFPNHSCSIAKEYHTVEHAVDKVSLQPGCELPFAPQFCWFRRTVQKFRRIIGCNGVPENLRDFIRELFIGGSEAVEILREQNFRRNFIEKRDLREQ